MEDIKINPPREDIFADRQTEQTMYLYYIAVEISRLRELLESQLGSSAEQEPQDQASSSQ